jgi:uroporphyrinogen-III synthase
VTAGPSVWVTRPQPGSRTTARAVREAGYPVIAIPLLVTRPVVPTPPVSGDRPDWVVFVSGTAARSLDAALGEAAFAPGERRAIRVAAVGRRTAETARGLGWTVSLVPESEDAAGLLRAFAAEDLSGKTVWIPGGSREGSAKRELPEGLAAAGAAVRAFQVYETGDRRLTAEDLGALRGTEAGGVVLHSPSAAEAFLAAPERVFPEDGMDVARRWRENAPAVAIGPVTARRLRELGAASVLECAEPSDEAIIAVLETAVRKG